MSKTNGYVLEEILLVPMQWQKNDIIVTVDQRIKSKFKEIEPTERIEVEFL